MVILLVIILGFTIGILRHFIRKGSYGLWNAAMHDKNSADNNMSHNNTYSSGSNGTYNNVAHSDEENSI